MDNLTLNALHKNVIKIKQLGKTATKIKMNQKYYDGLSKYVISMYGMFKIKNPNPEFWGIPITIDNSIETCEVVYNG